MGCGPRDENAEFHGSLQEESQPRRENKTHFPLVTEKASEVTRVHKRGWINSCHVVKNRGGKENGAAPSDESHPRSRGDTRVELSPETTCQLPATQEGTARPRRPGELRPTRPGAERWFRLLCTRRPRWPLTGTDFVVRGASEIRRRGRGRCL